MFNRWFSLEAMNHGEAISNVMNIVVLKHFSNKKQKMIFTVMPNF